MLVLGLSSTLFLLPVRATEEQKKASFIVQNEPISRIEKEKEDEGGANGCGILA